MAISRSASRSSKVAEEIRESIDRGELKPSDRCLRNAVWLNSSVYRESRYAAHWRNSPKTG